MSVTTSAYRFTRHAGEYAVTTREGGGMLGVVRRAGATWTATPATAEQGAHLYVTEHHTRHNAANALDAAHREATRVTPAETGAPVKQLAPVDSAPTVGDLVRIYNRSRWYDADCVEQRARTLQPGTWRILRVNRHGDWTVQHVDHPGTSHDVWRDDVEHIPAETETPAAPLREEGAALGLARWAVDPTTGTAPADRPVPPVATPTPAATGAASYATHCKSCDCAYAAVTSTDGPAIGYEYEPDGFTVSTLRHICWPRDERVGRLVAARRAAAGDHRVRVTRPAYTIEQGDRIVLDGDTVTVLDVHRDDTARTVTLTTSHGAPRTVTFNAAVPVVAGEGAAAGAAGPAPRPVLVMVTCPTCDGTGAGSGYGAGGAGGACPDCRTTGEVTRDKWRRLMRAAPAKTLALF